MSQNRKSKWGKSEKAARALRVKRLSAPITPEDIANFVRHLVPVSFGANSECWLYSTIGKKTGKLPEELKISTKTYAHVKFNGVTVNAHQFAYCASNGITLAELRGFDIHHASEHGRCIGYRCCNPDHLNKIRSRLHRGTRGDKATLVLFQTRIVQEVLRVPPPLRRPIKHQAGTGEDARTRFLGGVLFLNRGGQMEAVLEVSADGSTEPIA